MAHTIPLSDRWNRWVDPAGPDYCWLWLGSKDSDGYGKMNVERDGRLVTTGAHRIAYELHVGPIPPGLVIDHLCRNRSCVNPAHLEPVTNEENIRRGRLGTDDGNRRRVVDGVAVCINGHQMTPENTYTRPSRPNVVECHACRRAARCAYLASSARLS